MCRMIWEIMLQKNSAPLHVIWGDQPLEAIWLDPPQKNILNIGP